MNVSVTRQIIAYHLKRLKDSRPEIRLESIRELEEIGDPTVLEALEEVFRTDPEMAVRAAAQRAGKNIFRRQLSEKKG
ncbi:MAG: HEAT repeat domain-containing protein [Anaerolinea sp.]|nr:HEAT repeat domain-containing protein [Anaerolinea sp.]